MRVHVNNDISYDTIYNALTAEKAAGRIAPTVTFKRLTPHGSRKAAHSFEVQLEAAYPGEGRRVGNSGSYGAMNPDYDGYAATYDEWGWLLSVLYALDHDMLVGSPTHPTYGGYVDFHNKTGMTYLPEKLLPLLEEGHWPAFVGQDDYTGGDPYPYVEGRSNGRIGRRGAGRMGTETGRAYESRGWPVKLAPRTPDSYRAFAHIAKDGK